MDSVVSVTKVGAPVVLIRSDATTQIGTGHIMRCLALSSAMRAAGFEPIFLSCNLPEPLRGHLAAQGFTLIPVPASHPDPRDLETILAVAQERRARWVVVDGYAFDNSFQREIRQAGQRLLVIDDYAHLPVYECDILLNQNLGAQSLSYRLNTECVCLFGLQYALLRPEFCTYRERVRQTAPVVSHVLVVFGGVDAANLTGRALEAVRGINLDVHVVVGPLNPHWEELLNQISHMRHESEFPHVELFKNVSDMPSHMVWADLAITAAGSTCWELACLGVPLVVTSVAPNQEKIARELHSAGLGISLGSAEEWTSGHLTKAILSLLDSSTLRYNMSQALRNAVDGMGAARVVTCIQSVS